MKSNLERRNNTRLLKKFQATIKIPGADAEIDGVTENLSQGGAFISSRYLPSFQENDEAIVQLFLPPEMTGQQSTLILNGRAVVKRIDKEKYGIAVQFQKALKAFEVSM